MLIAAFVLVGIFLLLVAIISISDNLINIEAKKEGIDTTVNNVGIFPSVKEIFTGEKIPVVNGSFHRLKKGYDIKLAGSADGGVQDANVNRFAIRPTDFRGIAPIPKVVVEKGDEVQAGDELFFDKSNPDIKYVAPVSGEIVEVRRGAKRSISHVIILADKQSSHKRFNTPSEDASADELKSFLMSAGMWPYFNQRPFDVVADPSVTPDNIFVSTFNTAPLALDYNHIINGNEAYFQKGIDTLARLTSGSVHLGLDGRKGANVSSAFSNANNADIHYFSGKHPAGNVGVQIHHIDAIKSSTSVWTVKLDAVITLGKLMSEGIYDPNKIVALSGTRFFENKIVRTKEGASILELAKDNLVNEGHHTRLVCGDVLSGHTALRDEFMSTGENQITSLEEGNKHELFGWLLPLTPRPSVSRTFPAFLMPNHEFDVNTNTHGEQRAFVVTGQYEKVLPMDILPQHLMKAIMAGDIEHMEGLGINELSEEDVALCEFTCTSKMPLQEILRQGLDMMREQA